jgi:protein-L-isoaspartate O-methyltransferase
MPYSEGTKQSVGRSRINYSIPDPNPFAEGSISVPRVLNYTNGIRTVPIMHRAFRNLEIKYVNALVAEACEYRGVSAGSLRVLDIGYGLGYSTQRFYELGVGTYHCVEINEQVYNDANSHDYAQGGLPVAIPGNYQFFWTSFEQYADGYEGGKGEEAQWYDIIYYSPSNDDFGNMGIFNKLKRVGKQGTILGVQGIPLFGSTVDIGNFVVQTPSGVAPDADVYDSSFTVGMYNALNNIGYFSVYFQYLNCSGDIAFEIGGGLPPPMEVGDGSPCGNGTWINEQPRL